MAEGPTYSTLTSPPPIEAVRDQERHRQGEDPGGQENPRKRSLVHAVHSLWFWFQDSASPA
jgi:hypothetical protein